MSFDYYGDNMFVHIDHHDPQLRSLPEFTFFFGWRNNNMLLLKDAPLNVVIN